MVQVSSDVVMQDANKFHDAVVGGMVEFATAASLDDCSSADIILAIASADGKIIKAKR